MILIALVASLSTCAPIRQIGPGRYRIEGVSGLDVDEVARQVCGEGVRYSFDVNYHTERWTSESRETVGSMTWVKTTTTTTVSTEGDLQCDLMGGADARDPDARSQSGFCYGARAHRAFVRGVTDPIGSAGRFVGARDGSVWLLPEASSDESSADAKLVDGLTGVAYMGHRDASYCALKNDQSAVCFRYDGAHLPTTFAAVPGPVQAISGDLVLTKDGTLHCAGTTCATGVAKVAARGETSCALKRNGTVSCRVGQGQWLDAPIDMQPTDIALAPGVGLALASGRIVASWSLDPSPLAKRPVPQGLATLDQIVEIAAAARLVCARRTDGSVACWDGQEPEPKPTVAKELQPTVALRAGGPMVCALRADQSAYCLGELRRTQTGVATLSTMVRPAFAGSGIAAIDAWSDFVTLIRTDGSIVALVPASC